MTTLTRSASKHIESKPIDTLRQRASLVLMTASGFAGLGYQIVWTQQCAVWLGHEAAAVLAVVAAFFGGLAVGAHIAGPRIERSLHPLRWYVGCEIVIALWGLVLIGTMTPVSSSLLKLIGAQPNVLWHWAVAFGGSFLLLLPATAAMGATLPAMERVMAQMRVEMHAQGRSIAAHYASNTLGAVIGVLATVFWLVPAWGLSSTAGLCVALNLFCAVVAFVVLPRKSKLVPVSHPDAPKTRRGTLMCLGFTGLLGIGYEVMVVRVLSQVAEDTVYTFAMLLAVYLIGTTLGAAAYQRWLLRRVALEKLGDGLLCALAVACLAGMAGLWAAEWISLSVVATLGHNMTAAITAEATLALVAFGLPTVAMGALFVHLSNQAYGEGTSFGQALAVNTFGAALAPLLFGVMLTPLLGPKPVLLLIAVGYLALTSWGIWRKPMVWVPAAVALMLLIFAPSIAFIDIPDGGHLVSYQEGTLAAVSVVEDAEGVARLRINNRQQEGSSATLLVDARQALLPVLLHPAPHRVLFLGLGTGMTASSAAEDPTLQVDAVELLPEVINASSYFTRVFNEGKTNPRLHVMAGDARRYVRATNQTYDVIVSDNFHPARSGSAALYTVEHFQAVRARLAANGLFCQWLPLHQLDLQTLRSIVRSFVAAYPEATAILANNSLETPVLGLIGHHDLSYLDIDEVRTRLARSAFPVSPAEFGIEDEYALLGSFVAGPQALARFAGNAVPNTDDHPVVAYLAPRINYAPDSLPRDRLKMLLNEFFVAPGEVVERASDGNSVGRLTAYWSARNRFIDVGRDVRPASSVLDMLAQVQQPLLSVLRASPDFRPAYDPLLRMAATLARTDRTAALALLRELNTLQPNRPEAAQMAARLEPVTTQP